MNKNVLPILIFVVTLSVCLCPNSITPFTSPLGLCRTASAEPSPYLSETVLECNFTGPITNRTIYYNIYLPEEYYVSSSRYPVIYHLHGAAGNQGEGNVIVPQSFEAALDGGIIGPVIVVFPNGYDNSWWADSWDGAKPAETNVVAELIPHIDTTYRTTPTREARVIEGFSMGGFGAAKFIAKYYDLFKTCIIYDGAFRTWSDLNPGTASEIFNNNETYFNQYSPWTFVEQNAYALRYQVGIRMVVGSLTDYGRNFRDFLLANGIPVDYVETSCGHDLECLLDQEGLNSAAFIARAWARTVGGICLPTNKLELLAPYTGLTILLAVAAATVVYVKKERNNKQLLNRSFFLKTLVQLLIE